jgi:FKBP-type peptidyl-prolyl cis-trans isomerase
MMTLKAALKGMILLGIVFFATQALAGESPVSQIPKDKLSYSVGVDIARNFKRIGLDVDVDLLAAAMKDVLAGEKLKYSETEIRNVMTVYQAELRQKAILAMRDTAIKNKTAGAAFLAENKNKEGVVGLPSGLQYKILTAGTGKTPTEADLVECNYRGTLSTGRSSTVPLRPENPRPSRSRRSSPAGRKP